jgi:copper resistance protein C
MSVPRAVRAALLAMVLLAALPLVAAAHSELDSSTPADGAVVAVAPAEISGEFTEAVDPGRSSMELRGPDGASIARGGVPDGGPPTRMTIPGLPPLAPGTYTVRWTTVTADDDGVERGTFTFTVAEPTPALPTAAPTPTPAAPTASPSTASPTPLPSLSPGPTPSPTPEPDAAPAAGIADLLIPLGVLAAVLAGGAAWLLRRRR